MLHKTSKRIRTFGKFKIFLEIKQGRKAKGAGQKTNLLIFLKICEFAAILFAH